MKAWVKGAIIGAFLYALFWIFGYSLGMAFADILQIIDYYEPIFLAIVYLPFQTAKIVTELIFSTSIENWGAFFGMFFFATLFAIIYGALIGALIGKIYDLIEARGRK